MEKQTIDFRAVGGGSQERKSLTMDSFEHDDYFTIKTSREKLVNGTSTGEKSFVDYTVSGLPSWITQTNKITNEDHPFGIVSLWYFRVDENTTNDQRSATLTFTQSGSNRKINVTITQNGSKIYKFQGLRLDSRGNTMWNADTLVTFDLEGNLFDWLGNGQYMDLETGVGQKISLRSFRITFSEVNNFGLYKPTYFTAYSDIKHMGNTVYRGSNIVQPTNLQVVLPWGSGKWEPFSMLLSNGGTQYYELKLRQTYE